MKKTLLFISIFLTILLFNDITVISANQNVFVLNEDMYNFIYEDENYKSIHQEEEYIQEEKVEIIIPTYDTPLNTLEGVNLSVEDFNVHIQNNSPGDSPFIGQGEIFISIGKELDINPYYIYAHASLESSHGKSNMAKTKGNYFGIGAFNSSPSSALKFDNSTIYNSLYNGAEWIKINYFDKGQNTLNSMIFGKKKYAVYNDGNPNTHWRDTILLLMN